MKYYSNLRWSTWSEEVKSLRGDQAFHVYPPMFTDGPEIGMRDRRAVPIMEIFELYVAPLPEATNGSI